MWQTEGGERSNERGSEQRVDRLNRSTQIRTFVLLPANQIEHWLPHVWLCRETKKNPTEKKELFIHWIAESNLKFSIKCASTFLSLKSAHEWIWALPLWNAKSCVLSAFQALFRFGIAHFYVSFDLFTTRFFPPSLVLSLAFCLFEMFVQCSLFFFWFSSTSVWDGCMDKRVRVIKMKIQQNLGAFLFSFPFVSPANRSPALSSLHCNKRDDDLNVNVFFSWYYFLDGLFVELKLLQLLLRLLFSFFYSPHFAMITCNFRSWFFVALHS